MTNKQNSSPKRSYRSRRSGVGTGTTSLLVIFTVLCMATLALLSLSTAVSSRRINVRSFQGVQNLTSAEGAASKRLAEIDLLLFEMQQNYTGRNDKKYFEQAAAELESMGCTVDKETWQASFAYDMDENHKLITKFEILGPKAPQRYQLLEQMSYMTSEWEPEAGGQYWAGP